MTGRGRHRHRHRRRQTPPPTHHQRCWRASTNEPLRHNHAPRPHRATFSTPDVARAQVGKSCLVVRFVRDEFFEFQEPTIGAAFLTQTVSRPTATVKFEIWDTAGQERYHSLAPMYYRDAAAAVVVSDASDTPTYTIHSRSSDSILSRFSITPSTQSRFTTLRTRTHSRAPRSGYESCRTGARPTC